MKQKIIVIFLCVTSFAVQASLNSNEGRSFQSCDARRDYRHKSIAHDYLHRQQIPLISTIRFAGQAQVAGSVVGPAPFSYLPRGGSIIPAATTLEVRTRDLSTVIYSVEVSSAITHLAVLDDGTTYYVEEAFPSFVFYVDSAGVVQAAFGFDSADITKLVAVSDGTDTIVAVQHSSSNIVGVMNKDGSETINYNVLSTTAILDINVAIDGGQKYLGVAYYDSGTMSARHLSFTVTGIVVTQSGLPYDLVTDSLVDTRVVIEPISYSGTQYWLVYDRVIQSPSTLNYYAILDITDCSSILTSVSDTNAAELVDVMGGNRSYGVRVFNNAPSTAIFDWYTDPGVKTTVNTLVYAGNITAATSTHSVATPFVSSDIYLTEDSALDTLHRAIYSGTVYADTPVVLPSIIQAFATNRDPLGSPANGYVAVAYDIV